MEPLLFSVIQRVPEIFPGFLAEWLASNLLFLLLVSSFYPMPFLFASVKSSWPTLLYPQLHIEDQNSSPCCCLRKAYFRYLWLSNSERIIETIGDLNSVWTSTNSNQEFVFCYLHMLLSRKVYGLLWSGIAVCHAISKYMTLCFSNILSLLFVIRMKFLHHLKDSIFFCFILFHFPELME